MASLSLQVLDSAWSSQHDWELPEDTEVDPPRWPVLRSVPEDTHEFDTLANHREAEIADALALLEDIVPVSPAAAAQPLRVEEPKFADSSLQVTRLEFSQVEAAFFAAGEQLAAVEPVAECFDDLEIEPAPSLWRRLWAGCR